MTAYLVSSLEINDPTAFETYRTRAAASIEKFGGRYLVRGGKTQVLEGNQQQMTLVIVEFPDIATAQGWYTSPEYKHALDIRDQALSRSLVLADGVSG